MKPIYNSLTCPLKLTRGEVCTILLALSTIGHELESERWRTLHAKVREQLNAFDAKHTDENGSIILEVENN